MVVKGNRMKAIENVTTTGKSIMRGYLTAREAAEYCGYKRHFFYRARAEYGIPQYGPKLNRYKVADLDKFMADPTCFKKDSMRRKASFVPVEL